jgi:sRNA-binding protein
MALCRLWVNPSKLANLCRHTAMWLLQLQGNGTARPSQQWQHHVQRQLQQQQQHARQQCQQRQQQQQEED